MSSPETLPFWMAGLGVAGAVYLLMDMPRRDREAFNRECSLTNSREEVWKKALRYARRHDRKNLEKLRELGKLLPRTTEVIEVLKVLPSVEEMMRDPRESTGAKRMVLRHWAKRWQGAMGLPTWRKGQLNVLLAATIDDKGKSGIFATTFEEGIVTTI